MVTAPPPTTESPALTCGAFACLGARRSLAQRLRRAALRGVPEPAQRSNSVQVPRQDVPNPSGISSAWPSAPTAPDASLCRRPRRARQLGGIVVGRQHGASTASWASSAHPATPTASRGSWPSANCAVGVDARGGRAESAANDRRGGRRLHRPPRERHGAQAHHQRRLRRLRALGTCRPHPACVGDRQSRSPWSSGPVRGARRTADRANLAPLARARRDAKGVGPFSRGRPRVRRP